MHQVSESNFFLWEKKQLLKGGNKESLYLILEAFADLNLENLNTIKLKSKGNLYLKENLSSLENIWEKHLFNSIPIQHLCGYSYWRDLKLVVSNKVLIPRPETELVIDIILEIFKNNQKELIFAELGTGSGAISIALALSNPLWKGFATDIDKNVIEIASNNFKNLSNQSNLRFCCGHWWNPLENLKGKLDFVVSNPPYIPKNTYEQLPKEVKNFEPKIALLGGKDGLLHIREIIQNAPLYLKNNAWLIVENHFDQGEKVRNLFVENGFSSIEVINDYSGVGRFTIGRYK